MEGLYPCCHCLAQESIATIGELRDVSQKRVILQTWTNVLRLTALQHLVTFPVSVSV